jgi:DNA-directed RNA polymerase specialized sigma24 family protein
MDNRDRDAPDGKSDPSLGDPPSSQRVAAARPAEEGPAASAESPATQAIRDAVRAAISRRDTLADIRKRVARKVPPDDVDDVVQQALQKAVEAKVPPTSQDRIPGWLRTVVRRAIARYHRRKQAREEREGLTDLIDEYVDPRTEAGWEVDGWLIRTWLEKQVAGDDRDEELFDMLLEKAHTGMTYEALAAKYGMTLPALTSRIFRFKKKYGPRYEREKRNAILLMLGAVAVIALALALWLLRGRLFHAEGAHPPRAVPTAPATVPPSHDPGEDVAHPPPRP